jgi:hypothetical protein
MIAADILIQLPQLMNEGNLATCNNCTILLIVNCGVRYSYEHNKWVVSDRTADVVDVVYVNM